MSKVGIECLGSRGTEEYGSQNQKPERTLYKKMYSIIGIQGFDDQWIMNDMANTKHSQHQKPAEHERAKVTTDKARAKALDEEHNR